MKLICIMKNLKMKKTHKIFKIKKIHLTKINYKAKYLKKMKIIISKKKNKVNTIKGISLDKIKYPIKNNKKEKKNVKKTNIQV